MLRENRIMMTRAVLYFFIQPWFFPNFANKLAIIGGMRSVNMLSVYRAYKIY